LEYSVPGDCECTVCQQLQETLEYSTTEEDGFLYGLLVRITLLAADFDVRLMFGNGLIRCFITGAATPGELPGELSCYKKDAKGVPDGTPRQMAPPGAHGYHVGAIRGPNGTFRVPCWVPQGAIWSIKGCHMVPFRVPSLAPIVGCHIGCHYGTLMTP